MPRNAAKKTNKNAKRLPVLIKLKNNNNNKRKKVHTNTNNNKSKNNYSGFQETKQKKKRRNIQATKAFVNATLTNLNKIEDNCDANITIPITTTLYPIEKTTTTTKTTTKNIKKIAKEQEQQDKIFKDFRILIQPVTRIKFDELSESELKKEKKFNFENNLKTDNVLLKICNFSAKTKQSVSCKNNKLQTNLTVTSLLKTETETVSQSLSPPISLPSSTSPTSSISSLYPIVIETSESLKQDTKDTEEQQQQRIENDTNSKKKKLHSVNNCNSSNISTCCHTAAAAPADDTLEQRKKSQKNISCNNNKYNTTTKRYNNNSKQKQSIATTATTKVLTLSKPQSLSDQSQEVKSRLATLRIRKKATEQQQQQQEEQTDKTEQIIQKTNCSVAPASKSITEKDIIKTTEIRETTNTTNQPGKYFIKKASPVLDNATLNLIETLSDEVKKPNNKRRRNNTTAILLGLGTLHQPRPKRIAANPSLQLDKLSVGLTVVTGVTNAALVERNDQKQTAVNFLKPLPIESSNTNSKKRARIMSLYERPFQTANDGRGSVVSNGYMTSSRSSASSGGATGALVMNETCDTQDIANQYYLSGTSGTGIAANSNQSLVGNGSAINHAPTMGTLCNIGNTCYLNSVVYTLRFAPQFLHNLHHLLMDLNALQQNIARARAKSSSLGRGITAVHMENARSWSNKDLVSMEQYASGTTSNPAAVSATNSTQALTQVTQKSCHQLLTEKLHELYQSLHRNEISESTEPHHADTLLHAIQDVSSIFEGNQQQDAHEFLMCLLNSIRETSQTLIKAIAECPDVILNGYISNPDEVERDLIKNHTAGVSGVVGVGASNSNNSNSLASASSKTSLFFSRKSKRKDESKNSKNSRLQSPLKDGLMSSLSSSLSANTQTTTTANSLFYLNTNDLNTTATSPACATSSVAGVATANSSLTSPSNLSASQVAMATDETDTPTAVALILKDKQRLEGKIKELGLDFFNEDFEGITVSTTKCLSCETITEQKETMIDIAVPVPQAGYESNELMDRPSSFIQNSCITREYFRNGNKYRCEQCCGYTEAIRSISYEVLPRLLIIQLSRFSGGMEKINSYIPTSFTLQCFCSKCCELSDANKLHIYKLYSVITHVGATMSVGHYIAYTCSLEWANEYINCPKEQRRRASQERNLGAAGNGGSGTTAGGNNSQSSTATAGLSTSSTGFMKMKMKFGRSKASSSGDMSKNVKQLNGLNAGSKAITNGIGKLSMNNSGGGGSATPQCPITCQSIHCCAMRLTAQQQLQYQSANNSTSDFSEESSSQYSNGSGYNNNTANFNNNVQLPFSTSANTSGYGSTGRGSTKASYATIQNNCSEPIWYMCDDDKIKAMTQREFEELLSPARKITITPYLLFYARYNLQSTPPKSATASTSSSSGPVTSSPQTSWSNESLQSSGHSAHSSGIRM